MVKLFQRRQNSLFGEILDWMLTPLLLLWAVTFGLTWLVAEGIARVPFDQGLGHSDRGRPFLRHPICNILRLIIL